MWKIVTAQIREVYYLFISRELFLGNQKDTEREPEEQESSYILINIFSRTAKEDRKCSYVATERIIDSLKLCKIPDKVIKFSEKAMEDGRVELRAREKTLAEVKIQKGIF